MVKWLPGVCAGADTDFMLCVYNDAVDSIPVEHGDALAVARRMPQGMQDYVNLAS